MMRRQSYNLLTLDLPDNQNFSLNLLPQVHLYFDRLGTNLVFPPTLQCTI